MTIVNSDVSLVRGVHLNILPMQKLTLRRACMFMIYSMYI